MPLQNGWFSLAAMGGDSADFTESFEGWQFFVSIPGTFSSFLIFLVANSASG
jgi:hypothetical protein